MIVRLAFSILLLTMAWSETGPWTMLTLAFLIGACEGLAWRLRFVAQVVAKIEEYDRAMNIIARNKP